MPSSQPALLLLLLNLLPAIDAQHELFAPTGAAAAAANYELIDQGVRRPRSRALLRGRSDSSGHLL